MKTLPEKRHIPRVALLVESSRSYGRELLMGIARYLRIHGHWSVEFEESEPWVKVPEWFDRWKWDEVVPLSRSVLERRFTQILGKSPKNEILRVRLDRVCQLLAESDLSLVEVAGIAGFDHPEYMSRLFKKKMGITPGEFRKQAGPGRLPVL